MADCFENLFVEVDPEKPYPQNSSSDDENLLNVNFWFHCVILNKNCQILVKNLNLNFGV